jgi:tetratricopeptide (TPR) repeat protein
LDAAEEVCGADIDTLQSLVEKSLLRVSDERYWMLETVREYAVERLDEADESDALARCHGYYHLALLEERPQSLVLGSRRRELLAWFVEEEDNLRATLDFLEEAAPQDAARAADLLTPFWLPCSRIVEAQERFLRLLARTDLAAGTRAMLLEHLGDTELRLGQLDSAESHAQEAVTLARESGERRTLALALRTLAWVAADRGDFGEAIRILTPVLEEAADDEWGRSVALGDLAVFQMDAGRDEEARHTLQEASTGFQATGDEANQAIARMNLVFLELYVRDFEAAYRAAVSVLDKVRAIGDDYRAIGARHALGFAALGLGRRREAREAFAEALDLVLGADSPSGALFAETLTGVALATDTAAARSAARLQGAVDKLDGPSSRNPRFLQLERYLQQPLIDALGADEYASEHALGAGMDTDAAIDLARTLANPENQGTVAES